MTPSRSFFLKARTGQLEKRTPVPAFGEGVKIWRGLKGGNVNNIFSFSLHRKLLHPVTQCLKNPVGEMTLKYNRSEFLPCLLKKIMVYLLALDQSRRRRRSLERGGGKADKNRIWKTRCF